MEPVDCLYIQGNFVDESMFVSAESLVALFALQCCENLNVHIVITNQNKHIFPSHFRINLKDICYKCEYLNYAACPKTITNCQLPAVDIKNEPWVIVGLSSSVRYFLFCKANVNPNHLSNKLLGFRKGCLQACAEVSTWTKFCEIEAVKMLNDIYTKWKNCAELSIPDNIVRYENHLHCPPILHNALKRKQENLKLHIKNKAKCDELLKKKLKELPDLEHKYAEGIDFTLADIFLYTCFFLCIQRLSNIINFKKFCPRVSQWLLCLNDNDFIIKGKKIFSLILKDFPPISLMPGHSVTYPNIPHASLYKSDPERYKPRWKSFTHQEDIEEIIKKVEPGLMMKTGLLSVNDLLKKDTLIERNLTHVIENVLSGTSISRKKMTISTLNFKKMFEWDAFPQAINPSDGDLPLKRLTRKCQQLESMAQIVITLAKQGDTIVEFCAGGGHLGILLAFCLPMCKILLIENKKTSLNKAYKRVKLLELTNIYFYQCNLDYFEGKFDIGICLHACGVATDLVMQKCIVHKASFVCCPCCYGSIQPNHILSYPRSHYYSVDLNISPSNYLILGHAADQTHGIDNPKTEQGKKCMQYVDFDRLIAARDVGYKTWLSIMSPPECTPKNHILIGLIENPEQTIKNHHGISIGCDINL